MNTKSKVKGALEILLVIGLILVIPLFFAIKTAADKQAAQSTPIPLAPTAIGMPEINSATTAQQPPQCTFPLAEITTPESVPEEYTFSEPQVVLSVAEGNPLNVAEWLPDNQQVLVTEELRNQYVESNDTLILQSISLYNIETGESKLYAMRVSKNEPPIWSSDMNGVVYSATNFSSIDKKNASYKFTRELRVSYGDPNSTQLLVDNLSRFPFPLTIQPGGSEILYFSDKQISKLDKSLKKLALAPFNPDQWDYAKERRNDEPVYYQMAWQPGTPFVFLYSGSGNLSFQGGYTFVLNIANGHVCELNLGGPVDRVARWSSDGRYLAFARANSYTGFSNTIDLVVLDSITGDLRKIDVVPPDVKGQHFVTDVTWTPDNLHLLVFADMPSTYDSFETMHHKLYFVDFATGQSAPLFPEFKSFFAEGIPGSNNFVWSSDGLKLLARCPVMKHPATNRFCLMSVQIDKH